MHMENGLMCEFTLKINLNFIFIMEHSHVLLNIEEQKSPTHLPALHPFLERLLLFSSIYPNAVIILLFLH